MKKSLLFALLTAAALQAHDVTLSRGWNLVGMLADAEVPSLYDQGCEIRFVVSVANGRWEFYRDGGFSLEKGKGYLVQAKAPCVLSLEDDSAALTQEIESLNAYNDALQAQIDNLEAGCMAGSSSSVSSGGSSSSAGSGVHPGPETFRIGNAVSPVNYAMTAWMLNDLFKQSGHFAEDVDDTTFGSAFIPDHDGSKVPYLRLDAHGWPTSMTLDDGTTAERLIVYLLLDSGKTDYMPSGNYTVTYEGEGTMNFTGATIISEEAGRIVIDYDGSDVLWIEITETDPQNNGDYLRNIAVIRPDAVEGERFNRTYLTYLEPFSVIRPLHMGGETYTYGSTPLDWDARKPEDYANWGGNMGAPYEVMIDLANQSASDLWLNLPVAATDNFLGHLADLTHAQLDTTRKLYIELGNELWNYSEPYAFGRAYALAQAELTWPGIMGTHRSWQDPDDVINEPLMVHSWQGKRTIEACELFREHWQDDADRVVCVIAGQFGGSTWGLNQLVLESPVYVQESGGRSAGSVVDAFAVGTYIGEEEGVITFDRSSPETFFAEATRFVNGTGEYDASAAEPGMRYAVRADRQLAAQYGLPLTAYEGGHHFIGSSYTRDVIANHTLMYDLYRSLFTMWQEEACGLFVHYAGIIPRGQNEVGQEPEYFQSENFGIIETQTQTQTPKLDAVLDVMNAIGQ